jgi:tripartite-type tricarboxylate transporter receptor subunit TctC
MKRCLSYFSCSAYALGVLAFCVTGAAGAAQGYPEHAIRLILPVTPGGGTDMVARLISQKLGALLGQPVVVENHGGAGGTIAEEMVAHAKPDGYTLLVTTAAHATNPSLVNHLPYDTLKDFAPVTQLTSQPYLFVVNPDLPVHNVKEFVMYAQKKPGGISYASSGTGLLGHLGMEQLKVLAHFQGVHVPYKGAGPALIDTTAGHTQAFFPTVVSGLPFVKEGKLRAIAVTSAKRLDLLPEVPTVAESGYPGFTVNGWYGMLVPGGTPPDIVKRLHDATVQVLNMPDVRKQIAADGATPVGNTPEEFGTYIQSEMKKWGDVISKAGITAQ